MTLARDEPRGLERDQQLDHALRRHLEAPRQLRVGQPRRLLERRQDTYLPQRAAAGTQRLVEGGAQREVDLAQQMGHGRRGFLSRRQLGLAPDRARSR